jgi:hypothetical protein
MRLCRTTRVFAAAFACALLAGVFGPFDPAFAQAKLYRWVDDKGVTHFSDRPVPGATRVDVPAAQGFPAPAPAPARAPAERPAAAPEYSRVEIVSPSNDEAFVNVDGPIDLTATLEPELAGGHRTWWVLDGRRIDDVAPEATAITRAFERGTHTAQLEIVDDQGQRVAQSPMVTFHLRFNSIAEPPVGPGMRPAPPRPTPLPSARPKP